MIIFVILNFGDYTCCTQALCMKKMVKYLEIIFTESFLTSFWVHNLRGTNLIFLLLPLSLIDTMYMDSGGVHDTPLYLLSKGEKNSDLHKRESMCCQQFQRGRLLRTLQQDYHCCQHDCSSRVVIVFNTMDQV